MTQPMVPGLRPGIHPLGGTAALLPEQGPHAQLGGPSLFGQLQAVTNHLTQLPDVLGRQPYPRQITDPLQIRHQLGVLIIRFIGVLFHALHVAGVSQIHRPARATDQLLGQIGGPATAFDGGPDWPAKAIRELSDRLPVVAPVGVGQFPAIGIQHTHADRRIMVVQPDKYG